jgi:hypothetical protein
VTAAASSPRPLFCWFPSWPQPPSTPVGRRPPPDVFLVSAPTVFFRPSSSWSTASLPRPPASFGPRLSAPVNLWLHCPVLWPPFGSAPIVRISAPSASPPRAPARIGLESIASASPPRAPARIGLESIIVAAVAGRRGPLLPTSFGCPVL